MGARVFLRVGAAFFFGAGFGGSGALRVTASGAFGGKATSGAGATSASGTLSSTGSATASVLMICV